MLSSETVGYAQVLCNSYKHWTGDDLVVGSDLAIALYEADFAVVSHGTQTDPIFCYANLKAEELFELTWDEFVGMPSRLSAEPDARTDREILLERSAKDGFVSDYAGVRISKSGKRFRISDTILWQVIDGDGNLVGQAAAIKRWDWL